VLSKHDEVTVIIGQTSGLLQHTQGEHENKSSTEPGKQTKASTGPGKHPDPYRAGAFWSMYCEWPDSYCGTSGGSSSSSVYAQEAAAAAAAVLLLRRQQQQQQC
jgi:hypothetical protein